MSNYEPATHKQLGYHTNSFIDLNGVPYLLAEYIDRRCFQQIDRSLIRSEIHIDQTEAMRAVVDISVDDIGKRASDGLPAIDGNNSKQLKLLEMIKANAQRFNSQLDVLRRGIVLRVNYQLENQSTGQVIRSMSEDLRIRNRSYFLDINPRNINDNAIIVNFSDSIVSTINEFTHGITKMNMRITSVQMFYECVRRDPIMPQLQQTLRSQFEPGFLASPYVTEAEMYNYHKQMQNHHFLQNPYDCNYGCYGNEMISPPTWSNFNRFYHFDGSGSDIILHSQEINDPNCKVALLGAGKVNVNRTFTINPGHRIIFKFSIWKNDLTTVNDTTPIAQALNAPLYGCGHHHHHDCCDYDDHNHHHHHPINPDYETIIRLYRELQCTNDRQNAVINAMMVRIDALSDQVTALLPPPVVDPPEEPEDPVDPDTPTPPDGEDPVVPPDNPDVTPPDENGGEVVS